MPTAQLARCSGRIGLAEYGLHRSSRPQHHCHPIASGQAERSAVRGEGWADVGNGTLGDIDAARFFPKPDSEALHIKLFSLAEAYGLTFRK